jgi:hypothetical protein
MANAITIVTITHSAKVPAASVAEKLVQPTSSPRDFIARLINILAAFVSGLSTGSIIAAYESATDNTKASLAGTFTDVPVADETVTIGGVVFTAKASPSGESQFAIGANGTASATNLAAKIAAHSSLQGLVTATNPSAGVVLVSSELPGRFGNLIVVADGLSNFTWAGGATKLGGATATMQAATRTYDFGGVA